MHEKIYWLVVSLIDVASSDPSLKIARSGFKYVLLYYNCTLTCF